MSDNYLRLIPTDPAWAPAADAVAAVGEVVRRLVPDGETFEPLCFDSVQFVDAGGNFETVFCPGCDAELSDGWWGEAMDTAYQSQPVSLPVTTPCCALRTSLNDLRYDWPQGFSTWRFEVRGPGRQRLTADELAQVEQALGHPVREIWAHY